MRSPITCFLVCLTTLIAAVQIACAARADAPRVPGVSTSPHTSRPGKAFAMQDEDWPIDKWLQQAIAADSSNAGMRNATIQAAQKWDADMNRAYKRVLARLKPAPRAKLVRSQRAWLVYRDAETKAAAGVIIENVGPFGGTMWPLLADERLMNIVRARAIELHGYEELLKPGAE